MIETYWRTYFELLSLIQICIEGVPFLFLFRHSSIPTVKTCKFDACLGRWWKITVESKSQWTGATSLTVATVHHEFASLCFSPMYYVNDVPAQLKILSSLSCFNVFLFVCCWLKPNDIKSYP